MVSYRDLGCPASDPGADPACAVGGTGIALSLREKGAASRASSSLHSLFPLDSMDHRPPTDSDPRASKSVESCPGLTALIQFADTVGSLEAVERMLLAYAVHKDGLGFERAHLLVHNAAADQLVAWSGAAAPRDECSLAEAVGRAGLAPAPADSAPAKRQVRWPAQSLEGLAHLAWESDPVALAAPEHGAGAEVPCCCAGPIAVTAY